MPGKVLCVDAGRSYCEILARTFRAEGYDVHTAHDGESALAKIRSLRPDLVTLEVLLPKLDGFAVLEALRAGRAPSDPQLAALSVFVRAAASSHGNIGEHAFVAFLAAGYTERNALEVALGIAAYTLSITSNHLTEVEVDPPFLAHRWEKHGDLGEKPTS